MNRNYMETIRVNAGDLKKLIREVAQIKEMLRAQQKETEEHELTDWAKNELDTARKRSKKISHEEAKKRLFGL
jgi:hypothetical protein